MLLRDFAAAPGHFIDTYDSTNSSQVTAFFASTIESGSPDSTSNASPRLIACIRSERWLSARARVAKFFDFSRPATVQRTVYERFFCPLLTRISQTRTSRDF